MSDRVRAIWSMSGQRVSMRCLAFRFRFLSCMLVIVYAMRLYACIGSWYADSSLLFTWGKSVSISWTSLQRCFLHSAVLQRDFGLLHPVGLTSIFKRSLTLNFACLAFSRSLINFGSLDDNFGLLFFVSLVAICAPTMHSYVHAYFVENSTVFWPMCIFYCQHTFAFRQMFIVLFFLACQLAIVNAHRPKCKLWKKTSASLRRGNFWEAVKT